MRDAFAGLRIKVALITALCVAGAVLVLLIIGQHSTPDFTFLMAALFALCGFLLFDILGRRGWEQTIMNEIRKLTQAQERLIREVAGNRNDIADIREGLSDTALAVEAQGRKQDDISDIESRMIETIAKQLGSIGAARKNERRESDIVELTAKPPGTLRATKTGSTGTPPYAESGDYSDTVVLELLRHAVEHDQIDLFVQPIVSLPQRKSRYYELLGRIRARAGVYLPAERYMRLAEANNLVGAIDNLILLRCLQILRTMRREDAGTGYFLNIGEGTLRDSKFMNDLLTFVSQFRPLAQRLVFEMRQENVEKPDKRAEPIIRGLSQLGCRFSMDHIRRGDIDIDLLRQRRISFIKMDAGWLMNEATERGGIQRMKKLKHRLDAAGIDIVVEKIETEHDLRELLDFSIDYGQGYYFGKPDYYGAYLKQKKSARV